MPNSINVDKNILLVSPERFLNKNEKYYIYCANGEKSRKVCKELNEIGYNTINVEGGYNSYKKYINR